MIINKIIRDHNISLKLYVINTKKYLDNEVDSSLHYYEIFIIFFNIFFCTTLAHFVELVLIMIKNDLYYAYDIT